MKGKRLSIIFLTVCLVLAGVLSLVSACSQPAPAPKPTPSPTASPTPSASPSPSATAKPTATTAAPPAKVYKARFSTNWVEGDPRSRFYVQYANNIKQKTNGGVEITMFYNSVLYNATDVIPAVGKGSAEMGMISGGTVTNFFAPYQLERLWFIYTPETMYAVWNSPAGMAAKKQFENQLNTIWTGQMPIGARAIFTIDKPVTKLEDMKGLKARYTSKVDSTYMKALGMSIVQVDPSEVYNALQSKMVNTTVTAIDSIAGYGWWEFIKYATPEGPGNTGVLGVNRDWFNALPKDYQDAIMSAGQQATKDSMAILTTDGAAAYKEFTDKHGGKVTNLSADELTRVRKFLWDSGAYTEVKDAIGPDLWNAALQASGVKLP